MPFDFPVRGEKQRLTPAVRVNLPGDFVSLTDGVTHYQLEGPAESPVVVLVHGFSVPYFIWDPTFDTLLEAGYRVLRYDLFGRGYSDRPFSQNGLALFDRQLVELLDALSIDQVHAVLGLSMGGVIAANFTVQHPGRTNSLGLFDPAGFPVEFPFYFKLLRAPGLGELLFGMVGESMFRKMAEDDFYDPVHIDMFVDQYLLQMQYKGFRRSLLATMRGDLLESGEVLYQKVGGMDIPVLLVWGELDRTVPFKFSQRVVDAIPQVEFHPISNSGHIPHYEHADQVNPILLEFLNHE
jgi:pimeloyl-ACP methyl ester carboxylesterase